MKAVGIALTVVLLVLAMYIGQSFVGSEQPRFLFPDLTGPVAPSPLPATGYPLVTEQYNEGGIDALALWVNDTSASWYGLVSGLKSIGIPVRTVSSLAEAADHDVIMVYPSLTGANTSPSDLRQLADHVRDGGTLLAFSVIGGGMPDLFGFTESVESRQLTEIRFNALPFNTQFAATPAESIIGLGGTGEATTGLSGIRYLQPKHPPIASFTDGAAAITHNYFTANDRTGHAYALGIDLGHFILRAHNGRFNNLANNYVNSYQPKVDTFLRFIRAVYRQGESNAVLLSPTPAGKDVTVLMTHDIDFTASINNTLAYAEVEKNAGINATYFIQTKYITDYNDRHFFTPKKASILQSLLASGMEIASHSVAHSNEFQNMPIGSGREQYPEYRPFVQTFTQVRDATITGELRVSKFLLEQVTGETIHAFRPGHLSLPPALPQLLAATGYQYSSSMTANQALTHLPYQAMVDRSYDQAYGIYEFPVSIEDEQGNFANRLDQAIAVTEAVSQYQGLVNLLIHTETTGEKLEFVQEYIDRFSDTAWFGTVSDFGDWWQVRDNTSYRIDTLSDSEKVIHLDVADEITGLTLELPEGWTYTRGIPGSSQRGNRLSLGMISDNATAVIRVDQ